MREEWINPNFQQTKAADRLEPLSGGRYIASRLDAKLVLERSGGIASTGWPLEDRRVERNRT
jgi:hypothetical protein